MRGVTPLTAALAAIGIYSASQYAQGKTLGVWAGGKLTVGTWFLNSAISDYQRGEAEAIPKAIGGLLFIGAGCALAYAQYTVDAITGNTNNHSSAPRPNR